MLLAGGDTMSYAEAKCQCLTEAFGQSHLPIFRDLTSFQSFYEKYRP